ncbi:DsbA family oxidoreductase [Leucobacter sp. M11]|uniref:DsbA family oxidoreductase n=1 Tax=Leucobacter sp. M11 TaxID=2993565 RepID=UPI002D7E9667|nr:DsbA family oxidoreductase [Leucobacter sp. M11]MEB4614586.1 DsbA family oxidoreductase [Leucobacter sp. M11]
MTETTVLPGGADRARLRLDVWLDIACPWCAVGERRLSRVLAGLPFADAVDVVFHSFQLAPDAPERATVSQPEYLASRGMDMGRFRAAQQQLVSMGAELDFHFRQDETIPSNSLTAHRLIQAAGPGRAQAALVDGLFSAYFETGQDIGDPAVLRAVAVAAGLSNETVDRVLADPEAHRAQVAADIAEAGRLGITGVPFTVIDGRYGISGAQPEQAVAEAIRTVYAERAAGTPDTADAP